MVGLETVTRRSRSLEQHGTGRNNNRNTNNIFLQHKKKDGNNNRNSNGRNENNCCSVNECHSINYHLSLTLPGIHGDS